MKVKNQSNSRTNAPSLLEPQSRGGDTAEGGINFQAEVILSFLPQWLRMNGFTSMVRENMADFEAKFFIPGHGYKKEFIEMKNHLIEVAEFWHEVERFKQMERAIGDEYQWFTLISSGLHQKLHPLVHSLRRIRDPYDFHENSRIQENSYNKYVKGVSKLGKSEEDAEFLFKKVLIRSDLSEARDAGKALFKQSLTENLPQYRDLPARILDDIYNEVSAFIKGKGIKTVTRLEIENSFRTSIPQDSLPPATAVHIHTATNEIETDNDKTALRFDWAEFFAGENRNYPSPQVWNERLVGELLETKKWILERRLTRRIFITGNRRLSASLAIGSIFSAVAGFSIDLQQRAEQVFATDAHATRETPEYEIQLRRSGSEKGDRLIISIGINRDVVPEVEGYLQKQGLDDLPCLHIKGDAPIVSPEQANLVTGKIKNLILESVVQSKAKQLIFSSPRQLFSRCFSDIG